MDAAHHSRVQGIGGDTGLHQRSTTVDGGQARAAPGAGSRITQQGHGDGGDGIKAQGHQEGGGNGGGSAGAGCAFQEDRHHHTDDDELHAAVLTAEAGHGVLHILDGAGVLEGIEDHKRTKDHENDLKAFLDALPQQRIQNDYIFLKGQAVDIKVSKSQQHRPNQGNRSNLHSRLLQNQNTDQHQDDRADGHDKVDEFHTLTSLFLILRGYKKRRSPLKDGTFCFV